MPDSFDSRSGGYEGVPAHLRPMARAMKLAAKRAFEQTAYSAIAKSIAGTPKRGSRSEARRARKLFGSGPVDPKKALKQYGVGGFGRLVRDVERYASGENRREVRSFLSALGSLGKLISSLLGRVFGAKENIRSEPRGIPRDVQPAIGLAAAHADNPAVIDALQKIVEGQGAKVLWPNDQPPVVRSTRPDVQKPGRKTVGVNWGDGTSRRFPPNHPLITGDMVDTPESSNVYSYGYDLDTHSLYVRFKHWEPGMEGRRPQSPGAIYRYFNVPPELFLSFLKAPSKGAFVWDALRMRGTVSGHQFDYALVGVQQGYVPRKATMTAQGEAFTPREVWSDQNRRLKSRLGFAYAKRGIPRRPNDGRPNTGQPE